MSEGKVTVELLRTLPLFAGAPDEGLRKVLPLARLEPVAGGEELLHARDEPTEIRIVIDGKLRECLEGDGQDELCLTTLTYGELIGWSALLEESSGPATTTAVRDSTVVAIDGPGLRDLCAADHELGYFVMRNLFSALSARLNDSSLQLLDIYGHR